VPGIDAANTRAALIDDPESSYERRLSVTRRLNVGLKLMEEYGIGADA
jgi:hypothetical protein